jgi:hypothetical protein
MLQKMCEEIDGNIDPVRRKRYAQWNPNKVVYASWKTSIADVSKARSIREYKDQTNRSSMSLAEGLRLFARVEHRFHTHGGHELGNVTEE